MNYIITIIASVLMIGLVICIHEFGHFLLAKKNGIGVVEFSIGLGPKLFSKVKNGTRYSFRLIPFGGYCSMLGDESAEVVDSDISENLVSDEDHSFAKKSVWARISVIAAGPIFNFLLALFLAVLLCSLAGVTTSRVSKVYEGYPAYKAGLRDGDEITKLGNTNVHLFADITLYFAMHEGEPVTVRYLHNGEEKECTINPTYDETEQRYLIGILASERETNMSVLRTLKYSWYTFTYNTEVVIKSLIMLFTGKASINDLSGPLGIGEVVYDIVDEVQKDTAEENFFVTLYYLFLNLMNFTLLITANLGIMNLLPIPGMDGGRLLFLLVEAIRGKPIDKKKEGIVTFIGFAILLLLMVLIFFNDIRKIFIR